MEQVVAEQDQREDVDGADQRDQPDRHMPAPSGEWRTLARGDKRQPDQQQRLHPGKQPARARASASPGARGGARSRPQPRAAGAPERRPGRRAPRRAGHDRPAASPSAGPGRCLESCGGNGRRRPRRSSGEEAGVPHRTPQHATQLTIVLLSRAGARDRSVRGSKSSTSAAVTGTPAKTVTVTTPATSSTPTTTSQTTTTPAGAPICRAATLALSLHRQPGRRRSWAARIRAEEHRNHELQHGRLSGDPVPGQGRQAAADGPEPHDSGLLRDRTEGRC